MTITTETFRKTAAMLTALALPSADILISLIDLAADFIHQTSFRDEVRDGEMTLELRSLADHLGWDQSSAALLLRQANEETLASLGFVLCHFETADHNGNPEAMDESALVRISGILRAIIRGTALIGVDANEPAALEVDTGSAAMVALVARIAAVGGGLLYREAETAEERRADLLAAAATIARSPALSGPVFVHDCSDAERRVLPPTAGVVAAVLHGASVMMTTDSLFSSPRGNGHLVDEEFDDAPVMPMGWYSPTPDGNKLVSMLRHAPLAVIVPIPRNAVLPPRVACAFITAFGPLRRDRIAALARLQDIADGRLRETAADVILDLWESRPERARTSLDAVTRMLDVTSGTRSPRDARGKAQPNVGTKPSAAYSAMAEAMARGIAPHVWAPVKLQAKPRSVTFHKELFVCEPDASLLFSQRLREETGIRIMLLGPPGTGKSAAAAYIGAAVLGMPTYDVKMSDVLHYRLGALERAIAGAFQAARDHNAVLILDEADSIAQDRYTASPSSAHLVTATTNQLLLEMDRHGLPIVICSNFGDRIDQAVKRRVDLTFEVKAIPDHLEARAMQLLLGLEPPQDFTGFGGDTVISDYAGTKRVLRLHGGGTETAIAAVSRARDVRLGLHQGQRRRIGF